MAKKTIHDDDNKIADGKTKPAVEVVLNDVTDKDEDGFPIVGIGASAGGLGAFESFFSGMPKDVEPGMAFVLVQHLAPDHKSILTELVKRYTRMKVFEVEDGMKVERNCTYIIPPNHDMAFLNGELHLLEHVEPRGLRMPIDFFFRSLAQDQRERAICVVLSGTGSDGTLGVRAVKGEGGIAIAQSPESTEHDGMPRNAIATGLVDYVLMPGEMAGKIIAYAGHAFGKRKMTVEPVEPKEESTLRKIFILLRAHTGHDFSLYKQSTIKRRIERRMAVNQVDTMEDYVKHLQRLPSEVDSLFRDMLIGVTSFFRDPEAFKSLEEQVAPKLFEGKAPGAAVRVWSPGCSTGEEAYSLAILMKERIDALKKGFKVQVFATDIDSNAITTARAGVYPGSISTDVSPERLARYFESEPDGGMFRITKSIRDILVFSEQDVAKDPPFSRLDLISCRNLLIYMNGDLQKKLIPLFHYALKPGGYLFLGSSESVGDFTDLFTPVDRKWKLYQRKDDVFSVKRAAPAQFFSSPVDTPAPRRMVKPAAGAKMPVRDIAERALLQNAQLTGILVNGRGDILYIHGRAGQYLEPPPGEAGAINILKMAREGLRRDLTTALHKADTAREIVRREGLRVRTNGDYEVVNLMICPVAQVQGEDWGEGLFMVIIESAESAPGHEKPAARGKKAAAGATEAETRIASLTRELRAKEEYLQTATEQLQTSNEELRSSNEEMQSINEELQSTNEELETSKEELQSVNEELATVNAELQQKVGDLSRANNDMNNLLAGTGIGTIFVDHEMRILRFTPAVTQIINLIMSDVGRPVGHIVSNLVGYDRLVEDVRAVLDTLIPKECEVQTLKGELFTMRILPYRTLENVIEGVVITFINITDVKGR